MGRLLRLTECSRSIPTCSPWRGVAWRLAEVDRVGDVTCVSRLLPGLECSLLARKPSSTPCREAADDVGGAMNPQSQ